MSSNNQEFEVILVCNERDAMQTDAWKLPSSLAIKRLHSPRDLLFHLEDSRKTASRKRTAIVVVPLILLESEPGNTQFKVAQLCQSGELLIIGGLPSNSATPTFIHPICIEDIVHYPFAEAELVRRIEFHIRLRTSMADNQRLHAIVSGIDDGLMLIDPKGRIQWANQHAVDVMGCTLDQLRQRPIDDVFSPHTGEQSPTPVSQVAARLSYDKPTARKKYALARKNMEPLVVECILKKVRIHPMT